MKIALLLILFFLSSFADEKIIRMGYRTTNKLPYIDETPDNSGLYQDLYKEAARRIGYKLEIVRLPKKRVLLQLSEGQIDFYPGFAFNEERAEYSFWFNNGITQNDIVISRDDLHDLKTISDLKGLTYLIALGNPEYLSKELLVDVNTHTVAELNLERAIKMLLTKRADFYIYEDDTMLYYVKSKKIKGVKFHENLINRSYVMKVGFSRNSPLFEGNENPNFNKQKAISVENFPYLLKPGSVVEKFKRAIDEMAQEGYTDSLCNYYFK